MNKDERQREWEDALNLMTEEEMEFILAHPVGHYPDFLEMVSAKLWDLMDDPYSVSENKAMLNAIVNIIEGLGSKCEIDEDDRINFTFSDADFSITFDKNFNYIEIIDNSWKKIDIKNSSLMENTMLAVNKANIWNSVTIAYIIGEEENVVELFSFTTMPYYPNYAYLKKFIECKLYDCLGTHQYYDYLLKKEEEAEIRDIFSNKAPSEGN